MKIILDENLPRPLKHAFSAQHTVRTVQEEGLSGTLNGALLARLEGRFDVFVTADKNLRYQQNLVGRTLSVVELPTNRSPQLRSLFARIAAAADGILPGKYLRVDF